MLLRSTYGMLEAGITQAAVIALALFVLLVGCSLFKSRSRPDALTPDQLDEIRISRESAKEVLVTCLVIGRLCKERFAGSVP